MTELTTAPPSSAPPSQTIDFAKPFRFVFDDPDWIKKVVIGGLFYLLAFLLVGIFFVSGYLVQLARNVIRGDVRPLPEWDDLGGFFAEGVKIFVICLIYALPLVVLWAISFGGMALSGSFENEALAAPLAGLSGCSIFIFILAIFLYSVFLPAALLMYVASGSIGEAFNIPKIANFIIQNPANYILAYLVYLVANFLSQFGVILLCIGVIFTSFWSLAVSAYAFADAYRLSKK